MYGGNQIQRFVSNTVIVFIEKSGFSYNRELDLRSDVDGDASDRRDTWFSFPAHRIYRQLRYPVRMAVFMEIERDKCAGRPEFTKTANYAELTSATVPMTKFIV